MVLSRYRLPDAYTLEELRREYHEQNPKDRIELLKKLTDENDSVIPYEIAILAVEDPNVEVRRWLARYGKHLDYRELRRLNDSWEWDPEHPERDLEDRLKNDPDPFVRASLYENENVIRVHSGYADIFKDLTHLERLALVRNSFVSEALIKNIFDTASDLPLDLKERTELAFAYLSNKENIAYKVEATNMRLSDCMDAFAASTEGYAKEFLNDLWLLASKWPEETKLQPLVYRYIPANDTTKVECAPLTGEKS